MTHSHHLVMNKSGSCRCVTQAKTNLFSEFLNPPSIALLLSTHSTTHFIHTFTHIHSFPSHTHFHVLYHSVLEMSTRGEISGNTVHRGSLSWYARLVILQSQCLSIQWAPVCHLPVHSVCPKLWLPPPKSILQWYSFLPWHSHSTLQLACTHMAKPFADTLEFLCMDWYQCGSIALDVSANNIMLTSLMSVTLSVCNILTNLISLFLLYCFLNVHWVIMFTAFLSLNTSFLCNNPTFRAQLHVTSGIEFDY